MMMLSVALHDCKTRSLVLGENILLQKVRAKRVEMGR